MMIIISTSKFSHYFYPGKINCERQHEKNIIARWQMPGNSKMN